MSKLAVTIVRLEPMRVVSAYGFGKEPESEAWRKLEAWAAPRGYFDDVDGHPTYGFNNPNPSPLSPHYGYEIWMRVGPTDEADDTVTVKEFGGGLYAVTRFQDLTQIGEVWQQLVVWREESGYHAGRHQWLEQLRTAGEADMTKLVFDLYLPIAE